MDFRNYLGLLARRWRITAAVLLLGTVTGYLAGHTEQPWYQATATLFVSLPSTDAGTARPKVTADFTQTRTRSYASVVASPAVVGPVLRELRLSETPRQLALRIHAEASTDSALVRVSADDRTPTAAARIANAVARRFAVVVQDLDRPVGGGPASVKLTVALPAAVPSAPSMPRLLPDVTVGLVAGLVLGLMLALLLDRADGTVRSADSLAMELDFIGGPPLLATIPKDRRLARCPLAAVDDPHGPRAEGYRRLRTTLQLLPSARRPKVLAVTSALPGEGKTSMAMNLAAALAEGGTRVCLVDADLRRPRVADGLGLPHHAGLTCVLTGQAELDEVLQDLDTFTVLASGPLPANPGNLLGTEAMRRTLFELAERFDHVLVDTGPLLPVADATVLGPAVDGYLLVVSANRTTRGELSRSVRALKHTGTPLTGTVLNRARGRGEAHSYRYRQPTRAAVPSQRGRHPVAQPLTFPCGPTTHTTAPISSQESVAL